MQFGTGYKLQKRQNGFTFQIINSWTESWPGLTVIPSVSNLRIILSDLRFHNTFQFVKYSASAYFLLLLSAQNELGQRAFASKFFIICSC